MQVLAASRNLTQKTKVSLSEPSQRILLNLQSGLQAQNRAGVAAPWGKHPPQGGAILNGEGSTLLGRPLAHSPMA